MKKILLLLLSAAVAAVACEALSQPFSGKGILEVRFAEGTQPHTKAGTLPDTNDFILTVTDSKGETIYDGEYGAAAESFRLSEGNYTVSARSCDFTSPLFDTPQYGDTQVATVRSGKTTVVTLCCVQQNAGIRLSIDQAFPAAYPGALLYLKASSGKLLYSTSEKRIAYFLPGTVNLDMSEGGKETTLFSRRLEAQQILTLGVGMGAQGSSGTGVDVQVDTSRNWTTDGFVIGGGNSGGEYSDAMSVPEAKKHVGEKGVWVYGYIVGGDLTSSKCSFDPPFSSRTNLVIADKSSVRDKASCLSVQLAKGDIRDALNLADHPENLGRQIYLKGDIVAAYYGIPGIQNISEYKDK